MIPCWCRHPDATRRCRPQEERTEARLVEASAAAKEARREETKAAVEVVAGETQEETARENREASGDLPRRGGARKTPGK